MCSEENKQTAEKLCNNEMCALLTGLLWKLFRPKLFTLPFTFWKTKTFFFFFLSFYETKLFALPSPPFPSYCHKSPAQGKNGGFGFPFGNRPGGWCCALSCQTAPPAWGDRHFSIVPFKQSGPLGEMLLQSTEYDNSSLNRKQILFRGKGENPTQMGNEKCVISSAQVKCNR